MGKTSLQCIGIDDGILDRIQHLNRLLHLVMVSHRNRGGIMDHDH